MNRKFVFFLCLIFAINLSIPIFAAEQTQPEVLVEVYVNKYNEQYLLDITFDDGTKVSDYDYQIRYVSPMARGYSMSLYFDVAAIVTKAEGTTYSLDPTNEVRFSKEKADLAWATLSSPTVGFAYHPSWTNEQCLEWQFYCHFYGAYAKDRWNLDTWRNASSFAAVLAARCNP